MDPITELVELLSSIIDLEKEKVKFLLEIPPNPKLGDLAFPCFQLAKSMKKAPVQIAKDLAKQIQFGDSSFFESTIATGPYINFFYNYSIFSEFVFRVLEKEKENYGLKPRNNQTVLVETPSPNTNKPLHLGHLRNMALGESVARIIKTQGYDVKIINLYNDRGIHICKSMLAYKLWGNNKHPDKKSDHCVGEFYVLFEKKAKENPELNEQAKEMLRKLENNDPETIKLWKKMNNWAFSGMEETFKKFGLKIDHNYYESNVYTKGKEIILKGLKDGIFYKDDTGAIAVDLGKKLGTKYLLRADGTAVYITQDIYLAKAKYDQFKYVKSIYVVANEQNYHFEVLFEILRKLNFEFADGCYHLSYGMVNLPEGKMKSREGKVVDADDLIDELNSLATQELEKRGINKEQISAIAIKITLAALKYYLLKIVPKKDFTYNPAESISFEGDTGPYIQYTYVRALKIIQKLNLEPAGLDYTLLQHDSEKALIKMLYEYPHVLEKAASDYSPSTLTQYTLKLCQTFNSFYEQCRVVGVEPKALEQVRGKLLFNLLIVLKSALFQLGIDTVTEM
jgi:arginyl-tRNA synthetase